MWMPQSPELFYYLSGAILLFVFGRLFLSPLRTLLCLMGNAALGLAALGAAHLLSGLFGSALAINGMTLLTAALLGLPGVGLLLLLRFLGL